MLNVPKAITIFLSQKKTLSWFLTIAAVCLLVGFLAPLADSPSELGRNYAGMVKEQIMSDQIKQTGPRASAQPSNGDIDINWLVEGHYAPYVGAIPAGQPSQMWVIYASLRYERLAIIAALFLVIAGSASFIRSNLSISPFAGTSRQVTQRTQGLTFEMPDVNGTPESALRVEMKNSWLTAQRSYNGSLYLLAAGVVMAFVGIGAFIGTVPDLATVMGSEAATKKGDWETYALATVRPFGLLVFLEAIAWFLLRQYRSSTEDFKAFYRVYLRRSNYFVARKAYAELDTSEKSLLLAAALLSEDLSGRLSAGQSTEAIEAMKVDDANPVFSMWTDAMGRLRSKEPKGDGKNKAEADKNAKNPE